MKTTIISCVILFVFLLYVGHFSITIKPFTVQYEIDDKIDDMYYGENGWMESTVLTANVDTPQVIAENGYSE